MARRVLHNAWILVLGVAFNFKAVTGYYYRKYYYTWIVIHVVSYFSQYAAIWILLDRFGTINGWSTFEVLFLYSLNLLSYSIGSSFTQTFWRLDDYLIEGRLDDLLLRPVNAMVSFVSHETIVGYLTHMAVAATFIVVSLMQLGITLDLAGFMWLLITIFGASAIQAGVTISVASTAFWTTKASNLVAFVIQQAREFSFYPLSIYHWSVQLIFTVVVPYGFVSFYPAATLFDKHEGAVFTVRFPLATVFVGAAVFLVAYAVWSRGLRRYNSAGA